MKGIPRREGFGFQFTYLHMESLAHSKGLILERENPSANNGYSSYSITDNDKGTTALCKNLNEVYQELA